MQRLGLVIHISPSRNIITKTENAPRIGDAVVDENLKPVGKVFDIFGPTSSPYVAIRPATHELQKLEKKMLYVLPSRKRERRR